MILRWHVLMPLAARLLGYFPGNRLGWLEDLPGPAALEWSLRHPRFEETFRRAPFRLDDAERDRLLDCFAGPASPLLALSFDDDDFAQPQGVKRLLGYYKAAAIEYRHIHPRDVRQKSIGHFGFFQSRSRERLWPVIPEWFRSGIAIVEQPS
jgi:predicted alpha/beta hydrolase